MNTAATLTGSPQRTADIGIIGGSGLYELLAEDSRHDCEVPTPYGPPSSAVAIGEFAGVRIAFVARHGADHARGPHEINYRANVWAMAKLGVRSLISSTAVGSLNPEIAVGSFVVPDQLLDFTRGRTATFSDAATLIHLPFADPYSPHLGAVARTALRAAGEAVPEAATAAIIEGPRFATRAESAMMRTLGGDIVNMTQYPEAALAQEAGMGYVNLSFVTDVDAADNNADAVRPEIVLRRLHDAQPRIRTALNRIVQAIDRSGPGPVEVDAGIVASILSRPAVAAQDPLETTAEAGDSRA